MYRAIFRKDVIEKTPEVLASENLTPYLYILKIALTNARPNFGLDAIGKTDDLKEEEQAIFSFLEEFG